MESPGIVATPPVTTRTGSPSVCASTAHPSGIGSDRSAAERTLTHAVALLAWSNDLGPAASFGSANARGFVPVTGLAAEYTPISAGELPHTIATSPASARRLAYYPSSPALYAFRTDSAEVPAVRAASTSSVNPASKAA